MDVNTILAIDCGGSGSRGIVVDEAGRQVTEATGPAANLAGMGPDRVADVIVEMTRKVGPVGGVAVAVAGLRDLTDTDRLVASLRRRGLDRPLLLYPDFAAVLPAAGVREGVAVIAGTGSTALAVAESGTDARAGGWGSVLGDEGSGYWIGREALVAVARADDEGNTVADRLRDTVLEVLGLTDLSAIRALSRDQEAVRRVAGLTPAVAELHREGDALAWDIVQRAAEELARIAELAAERCGLGESVPVVLAGGVFKSLPELEGLIGEQLGPEYRVRVLETPMAWGVYRLARSADTWGAVGEASSATEAVNEATRRIDSVDATEMLGLINDQDALVAPAVRARLPEIALLVEEAATRLRRGGRIIYAGAGTSGRLAMLDAVECVPTFGTSPNQVIALVAGGPAALTGAVEGAEDDESAGCRDIERLSPAPADVVIGISASGRAPYVRAVLGAAREAGSFTAAVTCNPSSTIADLVDVAVSVDVGPEVIAGSTRLKAGTAQKLVLNMISTGVMVRLGRTLGNLMVGVRPANDKLRERAVALVRSLAGTDVDRARGALEESDWDVPGAVLALKLGGPAAAVRAVEAAGGDIAAALRGAGIDPDAVTG